MKGWRKLIFLVSTVLQEVCFCPVGMGRIKSVTCSDLCLKNVPLATRRTLDYNGTCVFEEVHLGAWVKKDKDLNPEERGKKH